MCLIDVIVHFTLLIIQNFIIGICLWQRGKLQPALRSSEQKIYNVAGVIACTLLELDWRNFLYFSIIYVRGMWVKINKSKSSHYWDQYVLVVNCHIVFHMVKTYKFPKNAKIEKREENYYINMFSTTLAIFFSYVHPWCVAYYFWIFGIIICI